MQKNIKIFAVTDDLSRAAAELFVKSAVKSIAERGRFAVALSGGSTPKKLYALLASENFKTKIDWTKMHFFFGDERHVAPESADSNFRMANETLFTKIAALPPENIYRVQSEKSAKEAAELYEQNLHEFFGDELPRFDLLLLGMGADGHTASLFPDSPAMNENQRFFVENWIEKFGAFRLTLTFPVINNARRILFLIAGTDKAAVLNEVLTANEIKYPAQKIYPKNGELIWYLDENAGKMVKSRKKRTKLK